MPFPLPEQPTWNIKDSSKLDTYNECPRKYFYEHVLGWRLDQPAHDLYFGQAWHIAREHQLLHGYEDVNNAYMKFLNYYRLEFPESTDHLYVPKTPQAVFAGLLKYAVERQQDLVDYEVVEIGGKKMTEISGKVPIDDNRVLHYKMDSIMRRKWDGTIESWDHKHTDGRWFGKTQYDKEYFLSIQNGTYSHCLYCLFPYEQVKGVKFCKIGFEYLSRGSAARPSGYYAQIRDIEAFKTRDQMHIWYWNVVDLLNDVERDMNRLMSCDERDDVMMAFRMNPKSCTSYRGCPFHDFCLAWTNPLRQCYEPQPGFRIEFWDPSAQDTTNHMDLEWRDQ